MAKLLVLAVIVVIGWKLLVGRWRWEAKVPSQVRAEQRARKLLGLEPGATRGDVLSAHKRLVAAVHPDRGGSSGQVHEANAARDLLLEQMPHHPDS